MNRVLNIAVIPGDGIGPEVTQQAIRVLQSLSKISVNDPNNILKIEDFYLDSPKNSSVEFRVTVFDLGADRYNRTGDILTDADLEDLKNNDVILLGAVGDPSMPSGLLERGIILKIRFAFDHYVNLRPTKYYSGVQSPLLHPEGIDFLVVREGTEGPYCGNGGAIREGTPAEIATEVSLNTAYGVERVVRFAFEKARERRKHLTIVHKHNVLVHAGHLWKRIVEEVGVEYPEVLVDYCHVDAATIYLVTDPQRFDVIVTDNLFGDIITDEAGAIAGGIGLAASGNINLSGKFPSMFEPVHGSAPDIAGTGKADPTAAILSVALMIESLDLSAYAKIIYRAVEEDLKSRKDLKASLDRSTDQIGESISKISKELIKSQNPEE